MAVNKSNIEITEWSGSLFDSTTLTRETTSDSFSYGDLVDNTSKDGKVDIVGDADKSDYIGVSLTTVDGSVDTIKRINVATKCVIRAPLKSSGTTIFFGECGAWQAGGNGTLWYFDNTATQAIVHCKSRTITATNYGLWLSDPFTLRAITTLGFFELPTA